MWNTLPNDVVEADIINTFKNRFDKYWSNQDVLFSFIARLIGTERRQCISSKQNGGAF